MASIFKPKGKSKYVIVYVDERGRHRKTTGATGKAVTSGWPRNWRATSRSAGRG